MSPADQGNRAAANEHKYYEGKAGATAGDNRAKMQDIRRRMLNGTITYQEAKEEAQPLIDAINAHSATIAKKYNQKPMKLSFAAIMR